MAKPQEITINKLTKNMTLEVTLHLSRQFCIRKAIFMTLLRIAVWVMGIGVEYNMGETEGEVK